MCPVCSVQGGSAAISMQLKQKRKAPGRDEPSGEGDWRNAPHSCRRMICVARFPIGGEAAAFAGPPPIPRIKLQGTWGGAAASAPLYN